MAIGELETTGTLHISVSVQMDWSGRLTAIGGCFMHAIRFSGHWLGGCLNNPFRWMARSAMPGVERARAA